MRKSRRQIVSRIIEAIAIVLVGLNLAVFFGVYRPLRQKREEAIARHEELRRTVRTQQARVEALKKFADALPQAEKGLDEFATDRIPPRREAYSTAAHLIHKMADDAGVKVSTLTYRLDTEHHDPLERLALEINAQGPYTSLIKFSHAMETSKDIILLREFNIAAGDEEGALSLRMGVDLYLTP